MQETERKWYHYAACQNIDLNYFFDEYENDPVVATVVDTICDNCPVKRFCFQEGVEKRETGVWGGMYLVLGKPVSNRNSHKQSNDWEELMS